MKYYPMFMDLAGRECLVVGAGAVAARKVRSLLECGAFVTVVGESPAAAFVALARRGVRLERRRFRAGDVSRQALVIAATDDRSVNAAVAAAARKRGIPINAVDDPPNCTFIVPAVVRRGDLTVAISTGGKSPAAARLVKQRISKVLGEEYAALVRLLGAHRRRMKETVEGQGARARAWKRMLEDGVLESLRHGDKACAAKAVQRAIAEAGAGPGGRGAGRARRSALETHNSPLKLGTDPIFRSSQVACSSARGGKWGLSPISGGRSGPAAAVPSRSTMRPPVAAPPRPVPVTEQTKGWRGGGVSIARTEGSTSGQSSVLLRRAIRSGAERAHEPVKAGVGREVALRMGEFKEVRSDRTPKPARKHRSSGAVGTKASRR